MTCRADGLCTPAQTAASAATASPCACESASCSHPPPATRWERRVGLWALHPALTVPCVKGSSGCGPVSDSLVRQPPSFPAYTLQTPLQGTRKKTHLFCDGCSSPWGWTRSFSTPGPRGPHRGQWAPELLIPSPCLGGFLLRRNTIFPAFPEPSKRLSMEGKRAVTEEREVEIHGSLVRQRHLCYCTLSQ